MRYQEYPLPPSSRLRTAVQTIWTLESEGPQPDELAAGEPVIPDGCAEIIVHFGDPFERESSGVFERQPSVLVVGQLKRSIVLRPGGRVSVLGIRIRTAGAAGLWETPQYELTGRSVDPLALSPGLATWLKGLRDRFLSAGEAAPHVADELGEYARPDAVDRRVEHAVGILLASRGSVRVDELARRSECTRRHLERLFLDQVGLTPKRLGRIRRFQWALAIIERATAAGSSSAGLAAATVCGYVDQSHFVHEFRELAGATPSSDLLQRAALTGLFIDRGSYLDLWKSRAT